MIAPTNKDMAKRNKLYLLMEHVLNDANVRPASGFWSPSQIDRAVDIFVGRFDPAFWEDGTPVTQAQWDAIRKFQKQ